MKLLFHVFKKWSAVIAFSVFKFSLVKGRGVLFLLVLDSCIEVHTSYWCKNGFSGPYISYSILVNGTKLLIWKVNLYVKPIQRRQALQKICSSPKGVADTTTWKHWWEWPFSTLGVSGSVISGSWSENWIIWACKQH